MTDEKKELETIQAPTELPAITSPGDIYFNLQLFEHVQRVATMFARSNMIPDRFKNNVGDCTIALSMAHRLKADPIMVMQNTYVVHGSPGIQGQFVIALINQCGKFTQLLFREEKNEKGEIISCVAHAKLRESGEKVETELTWDEVVAQGWNKDKTNRKTGAKIPSKWNVMRPQMFRYRSAAFFGRTFCPEVMFGMQTTEELHDVIDVTPDAGDKLNDILGAAIPKEKEDLRGPVVDAEFVATDEEPTQEDISLGEPLDLPPTSDQENNQTEPKDSLDDSGPDEPQDEETGMTSEDPDHAFNRTKWIACRAASTLQKLAKDHPEAWETTTPETKYEFHEKWKRILKGDAAGSWPFEDMTAPVSGNGTVEDPLNVASDRSAEAYINIFKGCESLAKLEEWFKANSKDIFSHADSKEIVAEYDRLMDANKEPQELVTTNDFLRFIYHAETTSDLSMVGMKHAETIDALPDSDSVAIWNRINEKMAELNDK